MAHCNHAILVLAATVCVSEPASALVNRAFVSAVGRDAGTCGAVTAPCKTLQYALDHALNPGGEADILTSGDYGPVSIAKAITIVNQSGGVASVTQPTAGGTAVTVAAAASDVVFLRGLSIDGVGAANVGVLFQSGATLEIIDCTVRRFKDVGIKAQPWNVATLIVNDVSISDVTNIGMRTDFAGGALTAYIQGLDVANAATGFITTGGPHRGPSGPVVKISNSSFTGMQNGLSAVSDAPDNPASLTLENVRVIGNTIGLNVSKSDIRLSRSQIVGNGLGITISGGGVRSDANNTIRDNGRDRAGDAVIRETTF